MLQVFLNSLAGNAARARDVLASARPGQLKIHEVGPESLGADIRRAVQQGANRIAICGGDGSIRAAAEALLGSKAELAILPCGTLNHIAKGFSIPLELHDAIRFALEEPSIPVDAATVNGRVFLNTSSVGAYVTFVRLRERLEHRVGYPLASALAAGRMFIRLPVFPVRLLLHGAWREYITPLVFVGVNERELRAPAFGARVSHGLTGLHVMVVRQRSGARALALALAAAARGLEAVSDTPAMDTFLVDSLRIEPHSRSAALDGELVRLQAPLEYRHVPASLHVVGRR